MLKLKPRGQLKETEYLRKQIINIIERIVTPVYKKLRGTNKGKNSSQFCLYYNNNEEKFVK